MEITVNGRRRQVRSDPDTPLLYVLRNDLGLKGTRFGCGEGTCGACMVLVDGEPVQSCDVPVSIVAGKEIRTVEGLESESGLHPLQVAFIAEQAAQCGYCTSGILMSACALLERNPDPSRDGSTEPEPADWRDRGADQRCRGFVCGRGIAAARFWRA